MTQTFQNRPRLMVFIVALLFSTAAPVTKFVTMPAISVSFYRSLVGIPSLLLLTLPRYGRSLFRFSPPDLFQGIFYAMTSLSFFLALGRTSAANATILFQTTPVFLIPMGYLFLKEKTDIWDLVTIILMMIGIILCFQGDVDTHGHSGDLIALGGAVSFAFMNILMRKTDFVGSIRGLLIGNILIVLIALPMQFGTAPVPRDLILAGSLGFIHMALPFVIYSRAILSLRALEASIYKNLETVTAPLWVALVVGEVPGLWTIAGFLCVFCALILRARMHSSVGLKARLKSSAGQK